MEDVESNIFHTSWMSNLLHYLQVEDGFASIPAFCLHFDNNKK